MLYLFAIRGTKMGYTTLGSGDLAKRDALIIFGKQLLRNFIRRRIKGKSCVLEER
jgi:hypothetical protein